MGSEPVAVIRLRSSRWALPPMPEDAKPADANPADPKPEEKKG
jgi:hypothetical protein